MQKITRINGRAPGWLVWVNLWIVYLVWGSTYLAIRVVVRTMPPLLTVGARFIIAGALMGAVLALRRGPKILRISSGELVAATAVGTALLVVANGLVMVAEQDVPSSLAALLIASVPLWVVILRWFAGEKVHATTLGGVIVGFAGVALLVRPGGSGIDPLGATLLLIAGLSWALGSFFSSRLSLPRDLLVSTTYQMLTGGVVAILAGLATGEAADVDVSAFSTESMWAAVYLVFVGSLIGFTAYVWLLQNAPISKVATYAYVNPVVAIFLGWAILSERITPVVIAGAALIVVSVAFIVGRETHDATEAIAEAPIAAPEHEPV